MRVRPHRDVLPPVSGPDDALGPVLRRDLAGGGEGGHGAGLLAGLFLLGGQSGRLQDRPDAGKPGQGGRGGAGPPPQGAAGAAAKAAQRHCGGAGLRRADFDQVICDGYKAAIQVLEHLYRQGHRRIGYLGEVKNEVRFDAYMDFMLERELPFSEEYIYESALTMENGYFGIKRMFASPRLPTAVFCANDISAIGAVKAIREFGLHIPRDISIISIDNIAMSQFTTPSLTTVDVPKNELGKVAVKLLLDRIEKGHTLPLKVELPCKLIVRESCRPLEKGERE
nr:substrate-binding domain-containing protein [Bittarella massiliensis (ex Durand et al. 2017)]